MEAFIFDLDGVICHTDQVHYRAWKQLSDELGIYFDQEINQRLRGVSRMESLEIILENSDRVFSGEEKRGILEREGPKFHLVSFFLELPREAFVESSQSAAIRICSA